jgi:hypothetical protein
MPSAVLENTPELGPPQMSFLIAHDTHPPMS